MTPYRTKSNRLAPAAVLLGAALLLVSCSSSPAATSTTAAASSGSTAPSGSTATSDSSATSAAASSASSSAVIGDAEPAYAAALEPQIEQIISDLGITGAAVLVRSPDLGDWSSVYGTRTWHGTDPVTIDDHIRIGSNTKPWTGTVILQLVDEGTISLDDPVSKYRPDVPGGDNITITQLLNMRSGLANYTTNLALNEEQDTTPGRAWEPEELVAMGLAEPPAFPPGEGYLYSNTNTVLLGLIAEQVTGQPIGELFQTRILDKVGMTQSHFPDITDASIADPHPQGYTFGTNVGTIDSLVLSPEIQAGAADGTLEPIDTTDLNPSWAWSAGAGISTAGDLADFVKMLAGGGLLSPELQQQRIDSVVPVKPDDPTSASYGLALAGFGSYYGHTGELPGYNSFMGYDPDRDITIITWASTAPAANGKGPAVEMAKAVIGALAQP